MKIVVGSPILNSVEGETHACIVNMLFSTLMEKHSLTHIPMVGSTIIADARNNIVKESYRLSKDFDYLLFVDADMVFPKNTLTELIKADKDICGVIAYSKNKDKRQMVFSHDKFSDEFNRITVSHDQGLIEVDGVGSSIFLIKRKVLDTIRNPWFTYAPGVGEDLDFCRKARIAGFKIYVDTDLKINHIGKCLY